MLPRLIFVLSLTVTLSLSVTALAQRGGRGGGGGGPGGGARGGGPGGPGGMQHGGPGRGPQAGGPQRGPAPGAGGFGGGLNSPGAKPGQERGNAGGGPYGNREVAHQREMAPMTRPGGTTRPGTETGVRPGTGAAATNGRSEVASNRAGTDAENRIRPGVGAGGVGGPASGIGVRPGVGAGPVGVGRPGTPATRYTSDAALAAQADRFHAGAVGYVAYTPAMYAAYPGAWNPVNLTAASLYTHPGYNALAAGLKLAQQAAVYDYGGNVVVQPSAVYVNGDAVGTPQQYAVQASQIATAGQADPPAESKWLPLGVFAVVELEQTSSDDVFQLAVNPQGTIRGNYHNVKSNDVVDLAGSVDKQTQRAAWTIGDDQFPVYEAGVANLTKDATPMLLHLGEGQTKQMTLIRLKQPE